MQFCHANNKQIMAAHPTLAKFPNITHRSNP
jgi:hypothetical protein